MFSSMVEHRFTLEQSSERVWRSFIYMKQFTNYFYNIASILMLASFPPTPFHNTILAGRQEYR